MESCTRTLHGLPLLRPGPEPDERLLGCMGRAAEYYDEIELKRLPAFADDSPEQYQAMIAEILLEIEEEGAAARRGRKVLGVEKILAQDPCKPLATGTGKKSPAPMLFFSTRPEVRGKMADDYRDFIDDYRLGSARMLRAAQRGYRLDSRHCLPDGSFPPAVVEAMLRGSAGFNPETAFPQRCFPRAWPFVGGDLAPPPPDPPSRQLLIGEVDEKLEIVWRGEIPTVHVPRRADPGAIDATMPSGPAAPIQETELAPGDPAHDPP